jgi:hypothetical protein
MVTGASRNWAPTILTVVGGMVDIEICDLADATIISSVKRSVRDGVGHLAGKWQVRLVASGDFGQWDLRLSGAFGHHVARFRAAPEDLPDCVTRRLRAFLHSVVPPLAVARRPSLVPRRGYVAAIPVHLTSQVRLKPDTTNGAAAQVRLKPDTSDGAAVHVRRMPDTTEVPRPRLVPRLRNAS